MMAGVLSGRGEVVPGETFDLSPLFEHVRCDGSTFRRVHDGSVINRVNEPEWAAIFEIGRLMHSLNVTA